VSDYSVSGGSGVEPEDLEDDGVLSPADSLVADDVRADVLDVGVDAGGSYHGALAYGTTAAEQRRGESLDDLLAEEEPDEGAEGAWTDEEYGPDYEDLPLQRTGRLVADDEGTHVDGESELVARDVGIDGGAASAEEAAVHLSYDPPFE